MAAPTRFVALSLMMVVYFTTQVHSSVYVRERIVRNILRYSRYGVLPQTDLSKPVNVSVDLTLLNIEDVDPKTNTVSLDVWVSYRWNSSLTFDPNRNRGVQDVRIPSSKVWVPDFEVYNGDIQYTENKRADNVVHRHDGEVLWVPKAKIRVSCDVDDITITNSTCSIKLGSWTYNGFQLSLRDNPSIDTNSYSADSNYELLATSAKREVKYYSCCPEPYEDVLYTFTISQK